MANGFDELGRLLDALQTGAIGRRDFLTGATALGVTLATAAMLADDVVRADTVVVARTELRVESAWGPTPKVLTTWRFKLLLPVRLEAAKVLWSGSGVFENPRVTTRADGRKEAVVDARFAKPGSHAVTAAVNFRGEVHRSTLAVTAKDAVLYAKVGSVARVHADAHGCPACPHTCVGPAVYGSARDLLIDGRPALRVGDPGVHSACCGPNIWTLAAGDDEVLYEGKALAVVGSATRHCGGNGTIITV